MRFTFADLKKTISRRKGEAHLVPFLLRPGDLATQLEQLIALFEGHVARERVYFPDDRPAEMIGDYRLARCLTICLSEWYEWRSPAWPEGATDAEAAALAAADIDSPSALRLALYDFVNATARGFLADPERDSVLDAFAASVGLARSTLDDLLRLDADPQQALERLTDTPPIPAQLATRYNQRAMETMLANASTVEWEIAPRREGEPLGTLVKRACFLARKAGVQYEVAFADSTTAENNVAMDGGQPANEFAPEWPAATKSAFADSEQTGRSSVGARPVSPSASRNEPAPHGPFPRREGGRGLGLVAERPALYAVDSTLAATASLDATDRSLILTLYGPQELTGPPMQYGERLARLCRALLGYRRDASRPGHAALAGDGLRGTARVYLHGRPLTFILDDKLLRLLEPAPQTLPAARRIGSVGGVATGETGLAPTVSFPAGSESAQADFVAARHSGANSFAGPSFDSSLESRLAEEWASLARERVSAGWRLEREPEPLLAGEVILVPDFALSRDGQRVYLEIAGYWRPEYRERKLRKLTALGGTVPLMLAAPESARAEFGTLAGRLPVLWYREYLSAPALLTLLEREYNDFEARLAALNAESIQAAVAARGRMLPDEAYALLQCYTRAELATTIDAVRQRLGDNDETIPRWVEGIGLCAPAWHDALLANLREALLQTPDTRLPLAELAQRLTTRYPELASVPESAWETVVRQADLRVVRSSLFAALVTPGEDADPDANATALVPLGDTPVPLIGTSRSPKAQPRPKAKRKPSERGTPADYATTSLFETDS